MPAAPTTSGILQIGDQWNAITIIAHSQTHPLKAICELSENAIDAGATHVRITRRRSKGDLFLEVVDDGRGVKPDASGAPDFERIATHLCDSMKRYLDAPQRRGVHGEFGIGLLSFWALGEELRMTSGGGDVPLHELCLARGQREYSIRPARGRLATGGTRIVVGPLLEATKNLVTGEKIARYLSAELRDRIRRTGVTIDVSDLVARKQLRVTPREFDGERLEIPRRYTTPLGDVSVEVYVRGDETGEAAGLSLCKDGTRVLASITELLPFQHAPWDDRRLSGVVDFEPLALAPGTRGGVVPDAAYEALVAALPAIEADILATLATREEAEAERASRQLLRQVHKAFTSALAELPAEEYLFFDIPKQAAALQSRPDGGSTADEQALAGQAAASPKQLFPIPAGPLSRVVISPRQPRRRPGHACRLAAVALDEHGTAIAEGISWSWRLVGGEATLEPDGSSCTVTAQATGVATVAAIARQWMIEADERVVVKFLDSADDGPGSRGLPSYRLESEHGRAWRSRYDAKANEIVINSAHRDFLATRSSAARHRRYIGKLYAKEVVLSNFPHESPAEVMERLIEVTLRTEDAL